MDSKLGTTIRAISEQKLLSDGSQLILSGYRVNEIVVYTLEDSKAYDAKNGTNYTQEWYHAAEKQGYIYLVNFAGYGQWIDR